MTRTRLASAAAALLLAWAALLLPAAAGAQTPSPSPSGSASASAPAPSPSASAEPEQASLALVLSAEPDTIEAGHETVLVAQVTNTGSAVAGRASLDVAIPHELEVVSSFPEGTRADGTLSFEVGPLEPGDSAVVQITARGLDVTPGAVVDAVATSGDVTVSDSVAVQVVVTAAPDGLTVTSRAQRVLSQVGSMVRYVVTVTNEGSEDLDDVLVVDLAPQELEVVSVDIVDAVEAVQIGESRGRFDVVWNVGSLPAGASIELPWDGRVVRPGDLTAVNSVRGLLGGDETVRSASRSFLADEGPRDLANPPFEPIEKRVVRFVDPPPGSSPEARAPSRPGDVVLPLTGISLPRLALAGLLFTLAGALLIGGARLAPAASGRAIAGALLAGLVFAACVSGDGDVEGAGAASPTVAATDDPRDEEARVKGERIVRGDDEESTAAPSAPPSATPAPTTAPETPGPVAPPATSAPPAVAAPATAPPAATQGPAVDPEPVRAVEVIRIGLADLPVETLGSRDGDNTVSFGWDEGSGVTAASSGTRFVRGAGSELFTDLTTEDGAIVNRLTLTNTHDDARLEIDGRLVHEVYSGGRLVARLRSAPIGVVLSPGGSVVARFSFLVPTGEYVVQSAFESSH